MKLANLAIFISLFLAPALVSSQTVTFNLKARDQKIVEVLKEIEQSSKFRFFYVREQVNVELPATVSVRNASIQEILDDLFAGQGISYQIMDDYLILLSPDKTNYEKAIKSQNQKTVTGQVLDETGIPITGVNVLLKGTTRGTTTDANGFYSLSKVADNETLVFSFIGMITQEIVLTSQNLVNVVLTNDAIGIEEVIAVGYGVQRKSDVTGSVGMIEANSLLERPVFNALQGIKGKIAGVNVFSNSGSPSGSTRIIIRGINSIETTSDPLYIVDGVAMEDFQHMNPYDIERIEVLKDASSAAIYGARGSNGVILVTTKRGAKNGEVVIKYDGYISVGHMRNKLDLLNSEEWLEVIKQGYENAPKYRDYSPDEIPHIEFTDPNLFDENGKPLYDTDWQAEATRTSISHNHQFSIQQGTSKSSVGAFLNYTSNQGIMLNSWLKRINAKIAYDAQPVNWLDFGMNMLINRTSQNEVEEGQAYQMPRRTMIEFVPILPVKMPDGNWSNSSSTSNFALEGMANPVHVLESQDRLRNRTQFFGNVFLKFHILPELQLKTQFGTDIHITKNRDYNPTDLLNISFPNAFARIQNTDIVYWQQETFLNYDKSFNKHRISSVLGLSWQERTYSFNTMSTTGFSNNFYKFNNIGAANDPNAPESGYEKWSMNSSFFRFNYSYNDKYLATFTARADGSSRFGTNKKYGFFPSAGFGWVVSEEDFMSNNLFFDYIKLRTSYGVTGNTELGVYRSLATVRSGTVLLNGVRENYSEVTKLPNPDLEWEKTSQFNFGLNTSFRNNRISIELDYYYKLTKDLLLNRPVPHSTGFTSVMDNIGAVSNEGLEVLLSTTNVNKKDFIWNTTLNINYNKNKIEKLGENDEDILPGPWWVSGSQTILRVGEALSTFWGYKRLGTWGTDEAAEAAAVGAVPGVAKRSEERDIIGKGVPDVTGSLINHFQYKNIDFSIDLQFVAGVDIMQQFFHSTEDRTGYANGLTSILYDSWTETNQNTMVQQIRNAPLNGQNSEVDDHWVVDGSYLRGALFSVGYTFDKSLFKNSLLNSLRIYANLENAFVIDSKDFKGYDPEATSWENNLWGQNIFFFQYPKPTTLSFGVSAVF
jgi:TonB-linked SusC/RagA family outer membrane protein